MKIADCTSLRCASSDCDYCPKCSHAIYFGEGKDSKGKTWRWEFNAQLGPTFVGKRGEPLARQPSASWHRAWGPFEAWHKEFKGLGA